ncbi:MAG: hypothetical protein ACJATA_000610 [Sphingobacteriales bacterium]|jgi:hypothetical protein
MKNIYRLLTITALAGLTLTSANAGNKERTAQNGGNELLINPWARSSGWGGINTASVRGLESINGNIGGLAFTKKTEVIFANTNYLQAADISINNFGFAQKIGESGVLAASVFSMNFGDIPITREDQPEGGLGTYAPQFITINLAYSKEFSNSIYGGIVVKAINENIANVKASGFAIDAGIQYVAGSRNQMQFGIALRNVGPKMSFSGDGLSKRVIFDNGVPGTIQQRSQAFELPSLMNIGASYDFQLAEDHRLTTAGNFTSNSFTSDQFGLGVEYGFKSYLMVRGGYNYESDIESQVNTLNLFTGFSAGATFEIPLSDKGSNFGIDYSYRPTYVFGGSHTIGVRIDLN